MLSASLERQDTRAEGHRGGKDRLFSITRLKEFNG